ncbi:MAG TPA: nucleoside triphosphate pyrophosphohydrolase [Chitinophagaceae bacterium]|nr:nucleoside triphosphate pyrophosphohydrolase [Chitinophagaceae bacterium]
MDNKSVADAFLRLVGIMDELREKCPWDRKQTIETLRTLTIEETYELTDAITMKDWKGIKEEIGDLLLHILFYAKIGDEQKQFTLTEAINGIADKLIARHPHIYGDVVVKDDEEVKQNWEKLKLKEGKKSVISGVPVSLPAVVKATRLQEKARQVGFEWDNREQVWDKVDEEIRELKDAVAKNDTDKMEEELGDLVFSIINYARFLQVDTENALERTNKKFVERFTRMEQQALKQGRSLDEMSLQEMDEIWNSIKKHNPSS